MQRKEAQAGPRRLRLMLSPDVDAPAAARRALRSLPLGMRSDDVLLVASELVSSALVRAGDAPADPIELSASCERGRTWVEIRDHGLGGFAEEVSDGYAMRVLAGASDHWGIEYDGSTRVWFELPQ